MLLKVLKRDFVLGELEANVNDCKKFWKTIKDVILSDKKQNRRDILLKDQGRKLEKGEVAGHINNYFINVGNTCRSNEADECEVGAQLLLDNTSDGNNVIPSLDGFKKLREMEVLRIVKDINISKSSGLNNISSFIVKQAFIAILTPVTHMFNLSLQASTFPAPWKKATIVPIPKSGDLTLVQNYRPISLLPLPGKFLEKLVHSQLSEHLETNSLLTDKQHGFRRGHSTVHAIAQFTNHINTKLDSGMPTLATYIDFRKAFDCVQHPTLLRKLAQLNFGNVIIDWVRSYLDSREQRVYANNNYSPYMTVLQGVPQGSVLGPLFYIVYANDLVNTVKHCKVALYADDTVLYIADKSFDKSVIKMQSDINAISQWCGRNGITANTGKSKVMVLGSNTTLKRLPPVEIHFGDSLLQSVGSYKYLGVTIDCQLNYNKHVNTIVASVSSKLKQFQRMRNFLNVKAALMVYKSMLLPILEYGDLLLFAATIKNKKRLQVLQNKGLRCALGVGRDLSTDELHAEANLMKLRDRRDLHLLNFMYGQSHLATLQAVKKENVRVTRSCKKRNLKIRRPKTEKFKKSLAYLGPKKWNALPLDLHQAGDKWEFKKLARNLINQRALKALNQ